MIKKFMRLSVPLWSLLLIALVLTVGFFSGRFSTIFDLVGMKSTTNETQVVSSMKKQEQVTILGLSVTDIYDQTNARQLFGREVPFSSKTLYLRGTFDAKLGFDGAQVTIEETGANAYTVTIPEFIVVGINNPDFEVITTKGEFLSFGLEDIDTLELAENAMNDDTLTHYLEANEEWLKEQATDYYENLLHSIDPDATLTMKFE